MEFAILDNGQRIVNVIVADESFVTHNYPGAIRIDDLTPKPGIGWRYQGGEFLPA